MIVNSENAFPKSIRYFVKLARPGSMVAMFSLLVLGGLIFSVVEFFSPGSGSRASKVFTETLSSFPDIYYTTLQVMFTAYVVGRSGQGIATTIMSSSKPKEEEK